MSKGFASNYRIVLLAVFVFAALAGLSARLVWLQVLDRGEFLAFLSKSRREILVQHARRGDIVDARGNLLATSLALREVGVDPQEVGREDGPRWAALAAILGLPEGQVESILTTRFRPAAPSARLPEGVGDAGATAAGSASRVVSLFAGTQAAAAPSSAAADGDDETQFDEEDESGRRPIKWAKLGVVSDSDYAKIMSLGIKGIYGNRIYRRTYPDRDLAAHVIGYVYHDEKPAAGVEAFADFYLKGENGWIETEKDGKKSHPQELAQFRTREVPPFDGYSVVLSLDDAVQRIAQDELAEIVQKYNPLKATIIVSDLRKGSEGFVLALANYPTFDPNDVGRLPRDRMNALKDVAATDMYEPGSVFKIVSASGALNEGLVTPSTVFDCSLDKIDYHGRTLDLPKEFVGDHFKLLTVAEILAHSSNRGAAQLGMMLGPDRLIGYARAFGFGEPTGFPTGGETESGGLLHTAEYLKTRDALMITRIPMGQSVTATPLQMQQAMSVIATGGILYRPQVIREICDPAGNIVCTFGPAPVRRVIREDVARTMARLLMGVASPGGTAPGAAIPGYEVAGKTGTAQKLEWADVGGHRKLVYSHQHLVTSFVGFLPASDPQVAISVIVDDPDIRRVPGPASGAKVAAPLFKDLGERLIAYSHLDIRQPNPTQPIQPAPRALAMGGGVR